MSTVYGLIACGPIQDGLSRRLPSTSLRRTSAPAQSRCMVPVPSPPLQLRVMVFGYPGHRGRHVYWHPESRHPEDIASRGHRCVRHEYRWHR